MSIGNNGGRPEFEGNPQQRLMVAVMSAVGSPHAMIIDELLRIGLLKTPIDLKTLRKHFKLELRDGKKIATARMGRNMFMKGMGNGPGAVQAGMFWLQTQGARVDPSWQKVEHLEITDKLTREIAEGIDLGIFTDDELAQIRAGKITKDLLARLAQPARGSTVPGSS